MKKGTKLKVGIVSGIAALAITTSAYAASYNGYLSSNVQTGSTISQSRGYVVVNHNQSNVQSGQTVKVEARKKTTLGYSTTDSAIVSGNKSVSLYLNGASGTYALRFWVDPSSGNEVHVYGTFY